MVDVLLVGAEELENLSTRYLAAVLRQRGYSVQLAAFSTAAEADQVKIAASAAQPRLIGLSIIFQYRAPEFMALAAELRSVLPHSHITTGGHFPSFAAAELLRDFDCLDSVVRGEGEETLLELMEQIDSPSNWDAILGLSFRRDGSILHNAARPLIADLDSLPFPARDTFPQRHLGIGLAPIVGSRGCYQNCSFCSIHAFYGASRGRLQRFRSVPNLVDEMQGLYDAGGVRFFVFNDDEWLPPGPERARRVDALERELGARGLDVIMSVKCRADDVEEDLFRRVRDVGVARVYVGIESGSDHSLQTLNKKTSVAQNRQALEVLNRLGMLADFGLIFFDPDSTVQDIRANLDFFHEMAGAGQAPLSFGRMEVYAGTPVQARLAREGRLTGNYLAWNYVISDPRVEMLFRLMIAVLRHRHYDSAGMGKQCSVAYYEWTMCKYVLRERLDPQWGNALRRIVAHVNNHSLSVLEEMFEFTRNENLYDVNTVNDQAALWAGRVNLFDMEWERELERWREQIHQAVHSQGG